MTEYWSGFFLGFGLAAFIAFFSLMAGYYLGGRKQ